MLGSWELYEAVYNRLTGEDEVSDAAASYTWAQEDDDPGLDFGRVEPVFGNDDSTKLTDANTHVVQVDFFAEDGRTVREALAAADEAIRAGGEGDAGYSLSGYAVTGRPVRIDYRVLTDPTEEGAAPVRHGVARYRFRTQHTGA